MKKSRFVPVLVLISAVLCSLSAWQLKAAEIQNPAFDSLYGSPLDIAKFSSLQGFVVDAEMSPDRTAVRAEKPLIMNLGAVLDGEYYRGGSLESEEAFKHISRNLGVDTVVTMRYPQRTDEALCRKYGLDCIYKGVKINIKEFDYQAFKDAYAAVVGAKESGRKVYFHCTYGSDRTGAMAAAVTIRARACGRSFDKDGLWGEINADLSKYGFHMIFRSLYASIKSWVYDFDDNKHWLCR